MDRKKFLKTFGVSGATILLAGCATRTGVVVTDRPRPKPSGPPPHAPAHGYRRKNRHGLEIEFSARLGVYIVLNQPGVYYLKGKYYRKHRNRWEISKGLDKKWKGVKTQQLPGGLLKR